MKMKTFTLLFLILAVALIRAQSSEDNGSEEVDGASEGSYESSEESRETNVICGENEVYSECNANPLCQRTCETLGSEGIPCPRGRCCIGGCICEEDHVRIHFYGACIHNKRCPHVRH